MEGFDLFSPYLHDARAPSKSKTIYFKNKPICNWEIRIMQFIYTYVCFFPQLFILLSGLALFIIFVFVFSVLKPARVLIIINY